jgi:hypothetical protein
MTSNGSLKKEIYIKNLIRSNSELKSASQDYITHGNQEGRIQSVFFLKKYKRWCDRHQENLGQAFDNGYTTKDLSHYLCC